MNYWCGTGDLKSPSQVSSTTCGELGRSVESLRKACLTDGKRTAIMPPSQWSEPRQPSVPPQHAFPGATRIRDPWSARCAKLKGELKAKVMLYSCDRPRATLGEVPMVAPLAQPLIN